MSAKTDYTVSIAIHGHIHFTVQASSENAAVTKAYEAYHDGIKPDYEEWETGYPCHTGWDVATASKLRKLKSEDEDV